MGWLDKDKRRKVHVASESVALVTALPLAIYGATTKRLPIWARVGFGALAAGTAVVDGVLLHSYVTEKRNGRKTLPEHAPEDDEPRHTLPVS